MNLAHRLVLAVEHVASLNLLEVQVVRHLRQQQHVHQIAACHQEFGDQIHIGVSVLTQFREFLLRGFSVSELLEQVLQRHALCSNRTVRLREAQSPP